MSEPGAPQQHAFRGHGCRRLLDLFALVAFTLLWLVPMAWVGVLGGPPASWPTTARDLYAVSCLFGQGSERVSVFYVQVRHVGERGWRDLDEAEFFRHEPFGHRSRFDRFMARFGYQRSSEPARRELASWLARRHAELHPDEPPIHAVRYLWADRHIRADEPPQGRWHKPPRAEIGSVTQLGKVIFVAPEDRAPRAPARGGGAR